MSNAPVPEEAVPISVNGRIIDPHQVYAKDAKNTDHIVLSLHDIVTPKQQADLEALDVEFQEDLGAFNYLCLYKKADLKPLRDLDWVRQVDVYRNVYKVPEELLSFIDEAKASKSEAAQMILINVMPHHDVCDADGLEKLAETLTKSAAVKLDDIDILTGKVQATVTLDKIKAIAADDHVRVIEQVLVPDLSDDKANRVVSAPLQVPGHGIYRGDKQVIAVIDTGFDLGSSENCHPAFTGRIEKLISLGRVKADVHTEAERYDDPEGHGTHVCGTLVGQALSTSEGLVGGVAPGAKLVVTSTMVDKVQRMPVNDIATAFGRPYKDYGARIFCNSWGDNLAGNSQRQYATDAAHIDDFVRAYPDALVIFSAGNNHLLANPVDPRSPKQQTAPPRPSIGSQAAAKNCLTVGASGSTRSALDQRTGLNLLDPDAIYPESSRGRTKERRIKPDVVAPGFVIFSARSRHDAVKYSGFRATSPDFAADIAWQTRSGTSHATPLVAGCAAVLRDMAQASVCANPPAALLKAVIINGADCLPGVPREAQGFGRVNLSASAQMLQVPPLLASELGTSSGIAHESGTLIGMPMVQGAEFKIDLILGPNVVVEGRELKVTMVYNDKSGGEAQNNLNLYVTDSVTGETEYGGESEDDMKLQNNVEQVVLPVVRHGTVAIKVAAQKIFPNESQDFVLAWALLSPYVGKAKVEV